MGTGRGRRLLLPGQRHVLLCAATDACAATHYCMQLLHASSATAPHQLLPSYSQCSASQLPTHLEEAAAAGVGQAGGTIAGRRHGPSSTAGGGGAALAAVGIRDCGHHCVRSCIVAEVGWVATVVGRRSQQQMKVSRAATRWATQSFRCRPTAPGMSEVQALLPLLLPLSRCYDAAAAHCMRATSAGLPITRYDRSPVHPLKPQNKTHRFQTGCRLPEGLCQTRACRPQLAGRRWCR